MHAQPHTFMYMYTHTCPPLLSVLRFCLTWACARLKHAVITAVSSYVQLLCCVEKILLPVVIYIPKTLPTPFLKRSWALLGAGKLKECFDFLPFFFELVKKMIWGIFASYFYNKWVNWGSNILVCRSAFIFDSWGIFSYILIGSISCTSTMLASQIARDKKVEINSNQHKSSFYLFFYLSIIYLFILRHPHFLNIALAGL